MSFDSFKSKDQVDYTTLLMWHMNRIAVINSMPETNVSQLARAVDIFDNLTCFLGLDDFDPSKYEDDALYNASMDRFRSIVKQLYETGFLVKRVITQRVGKSKKKAENVEGVPIDGGD